MSEASQHLLMISFMDLIFQLASIREGNSGMSESICYFGISYGAVQSDRGGNCELVAICVLF